MSENLLEPGRIVAGRYRIEAPVGEGGMGVVYRVRHVHTDEALALKVLHAHVLRDASAVERFRREARTPARIASEHVAKVTDADTAADLGDAPFYVMELLVGTDLERLVEARGPLAPDVVVDVLQQAARALDKAHALGIVHRDLKPENLFLTQRDDGSRLVKLLDFGIARIADSAPNAKKTQAGYVFGTLAYMAPEQALGEVETIGPATDVWALGLVAFKLLTGADFWGEQSLGELIARTVREPIPAPSTRASALPPAFDAPAFDAWFARCVVRAPEARFATASSAIAALAEALGVPFDARGARASFASLPPSLALAPGHASVRPAQTLSAAPFSISRPPTLAKAPSSSLGTLALALGALGLLGFGLLLVALRALRPSPDATPRTAIVASAAMPDAPQLLAPIDVDAGAPLQATADAAAVALPPLTTAPSAKPTAVAPARAPRLLTRKQQERLQALERLCRQATFTPQECAEKQAAIYRE